MRFRESAADDIETQRRPILAAAAGTLAAGALGKTAMGRGAGGSHEETLTIVHDLHLHGRFEDDTANIAEYWTLVQEQLDEHENAIFLGAGDEFSPSVTGSWFEGEHIVEALNLMGIDGVSVGNHENDFGEEQMLDLFEASEFPWLATNLSDGDGNPYPGTEQWIVQEVGGLRVGILGFAPPWWTPEGGETLDLFESTQNAIDHLRSEEDVDFVVGAAHLDGPTGKRELARNVEGLDAIVGDHLAQIEEEAILENDTVISVAGDEFDHLATVTLDQDGLVDRELFSLEEMELEEDPEMAELMNEYLDILEEELNEPVATAGVDLDARFDSNYNVENEYENLVTEAMAEQTGAEIAMQNAGGIRSNQIYEAGEITAENILDTLPFPDPAVKVEITGEQLVGMLLDRVTTIPNRNPTFGAQPQIGVHNIQYDWHGLEEDGLEADRAVENVHVHGEPVDHDATYVGTFSTPMMGALKSAIENGLAAPAHFEELIDASEDVDSVENISEIPDPEFGEETDTIGNLVINHAEDLGYLEPKIHNRIHRFDEPMGEPLAVEEEGHHVYLAYEEPEHSEGIHQQTFYAVSRTGTRIEASDVHAADGEVQVGFRSSQLQKLVTGVDDPTVRVFGGFDPDAEGYNMVPEGDDEPIDLPLAARFDYFVMRGQMPVDQLPLDTTADESDGNGDGEGSENGDENGTDGNGDENGNDGDSGDDGDDGDGEENGSSTDEDSDGTNDGDDETAATDDADDAGPGFGAAAAVAGAGGAAYMMSQLAEDQADEE